MHGETVKIKLPDWKNLAADHFQSNWGLFQYLQFEQTAKLGELTKVNFKSRYIRSNTSSAAVN
jgi:hypothetical protein